MIKLIKNKPSVQLLNSIEKFCNYTGLSISNKAEEKFILDFNINKNLQSDIGNQGYIIKTENNKRIIVHSKSEEGLINGIFTLLRNLMIKNIKNPLDNTWDIIEKPEFSIREMIIAPYRFGGSYGYAGLSPDMWSLDEWKDYIDFMRLCNMTTLTLITCGRMYHPDYKETYREKWRYEVWKEVIDYCHKVGMKCNWIAFPNVVPSEVFWDNTELRVTGQEAGGYFGCGLNWEKAKELIVRINKYTFDYLSELDGLEMLYSEAGFSFDESLASDPAGYFADVTKSYIKMINNNGKERDFVFWNWLFDLWSRVVLPEDLLNKFPKFRTILDDLLPQLPKGITWTDASMLSTIQMFGNEVKLRGNPSLREGLLVGKEKALGPVINCFWYMNPEYSINIFPHPFIKRAIQEAHYSTDEIGVDGVCGYRLAPPCKFIEDYTFFRVASDPSLTKEELIDEMAGLLCENPKNREILKEAINILEDFWTNHELENIKRIDGLLQLIILEEKSGVLINISHAITFLHYIVLMAQDENTKDSNEKLKREIYEKLKNMKIFRGFTSDIMWQPESYSVFNHKIDIMVKQYLWYKKYIPDIVDRKIYPKASSEFVHLRWDDKIAEITEPQVIDNPPDSLSFDSEWQVHKGTWD